MSHYKRNADANRDALFGPSSSSKSAASSRKPTSTKPTSHSNNARRSTNTNSSLGIGGSGGGGYGLQTKGSTGRNLIGVLTGAAKMAKMEEAEVYREKAKKALQRTMFSNPDPIAGGMFYHKASEAYKSCGENRLERLHRIASADCQMGHGAHATAASEYTRAAELSEISDETDARRRSECCKLYGDAANAWMECGERGRAAECRLKAAFAGLIGAKDGDLLGMESDTLVGVEEAVEVFCPDPLNRYRQFRKTGTSLYVDPDAGVGGDVDPNKQEANLNLCRSHLITASYSHEKLLSATCTLASYSEYASALYTIGAVSAILEHDGFATISLSRAYVIETILTLALGDVVAADKYFIQVHLQNNSYLESRECKLAEDLIRAVKGRDVDELEEARGADGGNKAALASLNPAIRGVLSGLRITGAAKKKKNPAAAPIQEKPKLDKLLSGDELQQDLDANYSEMDDVMNSMGLGDDDDDDDEFDLR